MYLMKKVKHITYLIKSQQMVQFKKHLEHIVNMVLEEHLQPQQLPQQLPQNHPHHPHQVQQQQLDVELLQ